MRKKTLLHSFKVPAAHEILIMAKGERAASGGRAWQTGPRSWDRMNAVPSVTGHVEMVWHLGKSQTDGVASVIPCHRQKT